jgi:hypothetical protein
VHAQDAKEAAKKAKLAKVAAKAEKAKALAANGSTKAADKKAKAKAESDAKKVGNGISERAACPLHRWVCRFLGRTWCNSIAVQHSHDCAQWWPPLASHMGCWHRQAEEAEELAAALRAAQSTPKGSKKDTAHPMLKGYDPPVVEAAWCGAGGGMMLPCQCPLCDESRVHCGTGAVRKLAAQ